MSTYEILSIDNDIVVVKDYRAGRTITLTKEEFETWKATRDKEVNS